MPRSEPSLARLFRDHGHRWVIEKIMRGNEWVAVLRDSDASCIIAAHDLSALRYKIEQTEQDEPEEHEPGIG